MADPFTEAWQEAVASVPKTVILHETLELMNPAFIDATEGLTSIRCVNDVKEHTFTHEAGAPMFSGLAKLYQPIPFQFKFPDIEEGKGPESQIQVDNLAPEVSQYLDAAESLFAPIVCRYRVYMSSDPTTVALGPFQFILREIDESGNAIVGKATMASVQNLRFLRKVFGPKEYPGLLVNRS